MGTLHRAHHRSSGSTRFAPSARNTTSSPTFEGLKTCSPRTRNTYLVSSDSTAVPAKRYHACQVQWSPSFVPSTRRISPTPLPVRMAAARVVVRALEVALLRL